MNDQAYCPSCGAARVGGAAFCSACGAAFAQAPGNAPPPQPAPAWATSPFAAERKPPGGRTFLKIAAVIVVAVVGYSLVTSALPNRSGTRSTPVPTPLAPELDFSWTPPTGFARVEGQPTVAVRWLDSGFSCISDDSSCWGMEIVTRDGCPSGVYVELSVLDSSGAAVGYTNDTLSALSPGQTGKLTFESFDEGARKARVTDVSCR